MLTDKQIFLYCGLLSLCFHFVAVGMYYTNEPSLRQNIKSLTPTILVTLIDLGNAAPKIAAEKKVQKETHRPVVKQSAPVVAFEMPEPDVSSPPEPSKKLSHLVAKSLPPQRFSREKPPEQPQQHFEKPPFSVPASVNRSEEPVKQQAVNAGFKEHTADIEHYGEKEESLSSSRKHAVSVLVSEKQSEGDFAAGQEHVLDPAYLFSIREKIEKHIDYPARAKRLRMAGKVNLSFNISETGDLDQIHIMAESPYPILNKAAILAVKRAAPFPQPRRKISVELPILFSLNRS